MKQPDSKSDAQPGASPGFFGKVTTHGDFVARRLPAGFLNGWDRWLQQSMQRSCEQLGPAWLDTYLTSPVWRFALAPQVCDTHAWAGILMPSVDRVGRHFPLTIAAAMPGKVSMLDCLDMAKGWYDQLEAFALCALHKDFVLDEFDAALLAMPAPPVFESTAGVRPVAMQHKPGPGAGYCLPIAGLDRIDTTMPAITRAIGHVAGAGHSLWWTDGSAQIGPSLLACRGLPAQNSFAAMLDGRWIQWGWQVGGMAN